MALWPKKSNQPETDTPGASAPDGNGATSRAVKSSADSVSSPSTISAAPRPELSAEQKLAAAQASRRLSACFGQIVAVLMRSSAYKHFMLSDLEWFVAPAVIAGQFNIAEAQSKTHGLTTPIGVVLWARVSPDVDRRLSSSFEQPIRLKPREWTSGEIFWIVDAIGDRRVLDVMLRRLTEKEWKGKQIKLRARDKDGKFSIAELKVKQPTTAATP